MQTIGQAYDDVQTQNQQLLQQITERDDYNIKVFFCHFNITHQSSIMVELILVCSHVKRFETWGISKHGLQIKLRCLEVVIILSRF